MVQSVWILTEQGLPLLNRQYSELQADDTLFAGFLSAVNTFALQNLGKPINEVLIGDSRFVFEHAIEFSVSFVICADHLHRIDDLVQILKQVRSKFIVNFAFELRETQSVNTEIFKPFGREIDKIVGMSEGRSVDISEEVLNLAQSWSDDRVPAFDFGERPKSFDDATIDRISVELAAKLWELPTIPSKIQYTEIIKKILREAL